MAGWRSFNPGYPVVPEGWHVAPEDGWTDDEVLRIHAEPTNVSELKNLIQNSGGAVVANKNSREAQIAADNWFWFHVQESRDGSQVKITETNYLLYGGLGLAVLIAVTVISRN